MSCAAFEARLEANGAGGLTDAELAHAASCVRCARALRAERTIEVLLAAPPAAQARADFTARVMARVDALRTPPYRLEASPAIGLALPPLWARLLAEPAVIASLALAAVLAIAAGPGLAALAAFAREVASPTATPAAWVGPRSWVWWLAAAWLLALSAAPLVRWTERLASTSRGR